MKKIDIKTKETYSKDEMKEYMKSLMKESNKYVEEIMEMIKNVDYDEFIRLSQRVTKIESKI